MRKEGWVEAKQQAYKTGFYWRNWSLSALLQSQEGGDGEIRMPKQGQRSLTDQPHMGAHEDCKTYVCKRGSRRVLDFTEYSLYPRTGHGSVSTS